MPRYAQESKIRPKLREAILAGFDLASLDQVLRDNDMFRANVAIGPDFATRVNSLIDVARQEGWLIELCNVLAEARSGNQSVRSAILGVQKWLVEQHDRDRTENDVASPSISDVAQRDHKQKRLSHPIRNESDAIGRIFKGVLSYARADAHADPSLIEALESELPQRINSNLVNDRFELWRDTNMLRMSDKWVNEIESALRAADILLVLVTPRWLGSEFCRKEYQVFEQIEFQRGDDDHVPSYVAPIVARDVASTIGQLNEPQRVTYESIIKRQHSLLLVSDFLALPKAERTKALDAIAYDILGIVERRRISKVNDLASKTPAARTRLSTKKEFCLQAYNYADVDYVSNVEVFLDRRETGSFVLGQIDFVERLYIKGEAGRIEFGVRRAHLKIATEQPGKLSRVEELKHAPHRENVSYMTLQDAPDAIGLFINPPPEKSSLGELSLPPAPGENYLARIARASDDVSPSEITAELVVSLDIEGLYVTDGRTKVPSPRISKYIEAIMAVAANKTANGKTVAPNANHSRRLLVKERI
jgi:hypothetical protein